MSGNTALEERDNIVCNEGGFSLVAKFIEGKVEQKGCIQMALQIVVKEVSAKGDEDGSHVGVERHSGRSS